MNIKEVKTKLMSLFLAMMHTLNLLLTENQQTLSKLEPKIASTLILLFNDSAKNLNFVLIKRPPYDGVHSDQFALPEKKEARNTLKQPKRN